MTSDLTQIRVRFSLRAILLIVALSAVGCALLFSTPSYVAVPCFIVANVLLPVFLTAGVIYWRGEWRALCIGGLIPAGLAMYVTGWIVAHTFIEASNRFSIATALMQTAEATYPQFRLFALATWMVTIASGAIVVAVRDRAMAADEPEAKT